MSMRPLVCEPHLTVVRAGGGASLSLCEFIDTPDTFRGLREEEYLFSVIKFFSSAIQT